MNKNCCKVPFTEIEIDVNGDVTVCCPAKNNFVLGNIYKESFENIWYSDNAKLLRQEILCGNYSKCNLKICNPQNNIEQDKLSLINEKTDLSITPPYPVYVKFCHDRHCNIKCITCRDDYILNSKSTTENFNTHIEDIYLPILKNCKIVSLNGSGEVFASEHCKTLVKKIVEKYPDIKFDIHTNGLLCNKEVCENLGILDKICSVDVSMHALKKGTYNKIHLGSNYDIVMKNIKWLSSLVKQGKLQKLDLYFVVQKMNYKEMIPFIKFAKSLNANVYFWEYRNWGTKLGKKYNEIAVYEKTHSEYNKFAKMLQNPVFYTDGVYLNNFLKTVKPLTFKERTQKIHTICRKIGLLINLLD